MERGAPGAGERGRALDEAAVRAIYHNTLGAVYGMVSRLCRGDRALAEDVVQETWMRAIRDWRVSGIPDRPGAWLRVVARNLVLNELRRRVPISLELVEAIEPAASSNGGAPRRDEVASLVAGALAQLPPWQRRLLERFHFDRRTVAEIAASLGISERAVEGRLRRARQNLKKRLEAAVDAAGGIE